MVKAHLTLTVPLLQPGVKIGTSELLGKPNKLWWGVGVEIYKIY